MTQNKNEAPVEPGAQEQEGLTQDEVMAKLGYLQADKVLLTKRLVSAQKKLDAAFQQIVSLEKQLEKALAGKS